MTRTRQVLLKRGFGKAARERNELGSYTAVEVLKAFATACDVKDTIQAGMLLDLLKDAEERGVTPTPYGLELSAWVQRIVHASAYDAKGEAEDRAVRKKAKTGHDSYPFRAEIEFKCELSWFLVAKPKDQDCKISLAEHDEGYSLWIQCEERRGPIRKAIERAMALMDALDEKHGLRIWVPEGMNYELDDHERRSILDIKGTAEHYRLW